MKNKETEPKGNSEGWKNIGSRDILIEARNMFFDGSMLL